MICEMVMIFGFWINPCNVDHMYPTLAKPRPEIKAVPSCKLFFGEKELIIFQKCNRVAKELKNETNDTE